MKYVVTWRERPGGSAKDYEDALKTTELGIRSYGGVPVRDSAGTVVATLCGIDRGSVEVDQATVPLVHAGHRQDLVADLAVGGQVTGPVAVLDAEVLPRRRQHSCPDRASGDRWSARTT